MVGAVLEQPLLPAHLLGFWVRLPAGLRALWRAVLSGRVVQLKALALGAHLAILIASAVRRW